VRGHVVLWYGGDEYEGIRTRVEKIDRSPCNKYTGGRGGTYTRWVDGRYSWDSKAGLHSGDCTRPADDDAIVPFEWAPPW